MPLDGLVESSNYTAVGAEDILTSITDNDSSTYITTDTVPATVELSVAPISAYIPDHEKAIVTSGAIYENYGWVPVDINSKHVGVDMIKVRAGGVSSTQANRTFTMQVKDTVSNNTQTGSSTGLIADPDSFTNVYAQGTSGEWNLTNLSAGDFTIKLETT